MSKRKTVANHSIQKRIPRYLQHLMPVQGSFIKFWVKNQQLIHVTAVWVAKMFLLGLGSGSSISNTWELIRYAYYGAYPHTHWIRNLALGPEICVLISHPGGSMQAKLESHLPQPIQQDGVSPSLCLALTCCRFFQSTANRGSLHCTFSMMACIQNKHTNLCEFLTQELFPKNAPLRTQDADLLIS